MHGGLLPAFWPRGVSPSPVNNLITGLISAWTINRTWFSGRPPGSELHLNPVWFGDKLNSTEGKIKGNGVKLGSTASYFPHSFYDCISATSVQITQERQAFVIRTGCLCTLCSCSGFMLILIVQDLKIILFFCHSLCTCITADIVLVTH